MARAGFVVGAAFFALSCTNIGDFSTAEGECYRGEVVHSPFVLTGFEAGTQLFMTLDTKALGDGTTDAGPENAGVIWTSDGKFKGSAITQMEEVAHDSLSQFQFPGGRLRNYLIYVVAADGAPTMVVISLMENDFVEARVMRPGMTLCPPGDSACVDPVRFDPLFGIFRLNVDDTCNAPDPVQ